VNVLEIGRPFDLGPMIMSAALGLLMAFIAYGRMFLKPIV
jgi:hypothetical protein